MAERDTSTPSPAPNFHDYPALLRNAVAYLQTKYPKATVMFGQIAFQSQPGGDTLYKVWILTAQDSAAGAQVRAIVVEDLGRQDFALLAQRAAGLFSGGGVEIRFGPSSGASGMSSAEMPFSARLVLYTNATHVPHEQIRGVFEAAKLLVEIVDESALFKSLFISYGGSDRKAATAINRFLKDRGIKTWFFPDDALPGEKLHRMMHDRISSHDRVLLLCSKKALSRAGVLNELERVLEREAREGGSEILIPITLDDFVYGDWAPTRPDLAAQVRTRVIYKIKVPKDGRLNGNPELEKLVRALSRGPALVGDRNHFGAQTERKHQAPAESEELRRSRILAQLRQLYIATHDNVSPEMLTGIAPLPKDWTEEKLKQRGEVWRRDAYY